jgi:rsbT co-antagonist protein RsbR
MNNNNTTLEELQTENARLREQLAEQQQKARTAEQNYNSLFTNMTIGSFITDMQRNIQECNPIFQTMLGYTTEELQTISLTALTPEKWHALDQEKHQNELVSRGYTELYQKEYICKDGTILPVEVRCHLITDEQGQPAGIYGFARDITAQHQQEKELRTFKSLVEYALDGIGVSDSQGNFVYANPSYQAMTGYGSAMIGMPVMTLYDSNEVDLSPIIDEVLGSGKWQGVLPFTRQNQTIFQGQCSIYRIQDPNEAGFLLAAIVRDITEQQKVQQELRTFKTLVDKAPDGINVTTPDARIFYANESFRSLSGYYDEAIGKTIVDLYADDPESLMTAAQQVAEQGYWHGPFTLCQPDGTLIPVFTSVFAIQDVQGTVRWLAAIVRDMSEQQRQEQERQEMQQQIIDAQRAALRELSTPLLPLANGVIAMPLLGTIDSNRALQVMETLLEGVSSHHAETAILDITGVQILDTQIANVLMQAAQAVKLLGAQVILTGIRPTMAQTLVSLGVDLSSIVTRSTLERGIAYALGK